jgi:hypothetical protein
MESRERRIEKSIIEIHSNVGQILLHFVALVIHAIARMISSSGCEDILPSRHLTRLVDLADMLSFTFYKFSYMICTVNVPIR